MNNKREILILMHTHWDREWYFTKDETKVLLRNHMQEVLEFLDENRDVVYILDGQSVMLDDFIELAPEWEERIKSLVERNQLRIGPWYTQTDLLIVHGESIIRNLYYGFKTAKKYGDVMRIGYAPDTFGHSSQMPQIYKLFDINSTFFWRGFSELKANKSDFIWEGVDGSKIYGINLSTGYQGAKYLENEYEPLKSRFDKLLNVLDKYSAGNARLIMNGHDQMPIQKDIHKVIDLVKQIYPGDTVQISDFESYIDQLKNIELETVKGELTHSKHARIHRTINSTRMDIKLLNSELEHKLYNMLEPLSILATSIGLEYPHAMLEKCYKELFGIHAHDSIGGCNSDKVNRDIKQRLLIVKEMVDTQIELYMRLISMSSLENNVITLYNFLPYKRFNEYTELEMITRSSNFKLFDDKGIEINYTLLSQEIIDAGLIDRQVAARLLDIKVFSSKIKFIVDEIDGLNVRYISYEDGDILFENYSKKINDCEFINDSPFIENEYYKIIVKNNLINIENKKTNEFIENAIFIENSGDAGDSYDYSPPMNDYVVNSNIGKIENISKISKNGIEIMKFDIFMNVPKNIIERENKKCTEDIVLTLTLELSEKENVIRTRIKHVNKIYDSRYRFAFDTRVKTEYVESDSHLSVVHKQVYLDKELSIWETDKWVEKPVSIETYQSYVSLSNNYNDLSENIQSNRKTIISNGLKEYEVVDGIIYITLFRSFSHLGKRELVNRPGRPSGIEIETPDNQLINQEFNIELGIVLEHELIHPTQISKQFLTPIKSYQLKEFNRFNLNKPIINKKIKEELNLDLNGCVVSALKFREESNDIFIRIFNPYNSIRSIEFKNLIEEHIYISTPMEEIINRIDSYNLKPQEILNLVIIK